MWQEITDKNKWNELLKDAPAASFLQSWEWGQFQQSVGREVKRLLWQDKIFLQMIKMNLPLGRCYWYIPRGPLVVSGKSDYGRAIGGLLDFLKKDDKWIALEVNSTPAFDFFECERRKMVNELVDLLVKLARKKN